MKSGISFSPIKMKEETGQSQKWSFVEESMLRKSTGGSDQKQNKKEHRFIFSPFFSSSFIGFTETISHRISALPHYFQRSLNFFFQRKLKKKDLSHFLDSFAFFCNNFSHSKINKTLIIKTSEAKSS